MTHSRLHGRLTASRRRRCFLHCTVAQLASLCLLIAVGCAPSRGTPESITLATTTSTRDSGLLDVLLPMFEQQTGITVHVVAVGSGQALEMGRRGDADALLTHAPEAEEEFMAAGYGSDRQCVMWNDFVLVGPVADPAGVLDTSNIVQALSQIAGSQSTFVSRGDRSGTHMKETRMWKAAEIEPEGEWYLSTGSGMGQSLRMASEKGAYTLSDRGTFLAQQAMLDLLIVLEGDPRLRNPYAVILVDPARHPHVRQSAARRFAQFLVAPKTQEAIARFGVERFGQPLFFPNVGDTSFNGKPQATAF